MTIYKYTPDGVWGEWYNGSFLLVGYPDGQPISWEISSGQLPDGISLSAGDSDSAEIFGYPQKTGTFNFTIKATCGGEEATQNCTIIITKNIVIDCPPSTGAVFTYYDGAAAVTGSNYLQSATILSGSLPTGLQIAVDAYSVLLTGYPTAIGTYNFVIEITDADGDKDTKACEIVIECPTITLPDLPPAYRGRMYQFSLAASPSGNGAVYSYAVTSGALPPRVTLNTSTGLLSGWLNLGTFTFTISATLASPNQSCTTSREYTLIVSNDPLVARPFISCDGTKSYLNCDKTKALISYAPANCSQLHGFRSMTFEFSGCTNNQCSPAYSSMYLGDFNFTVTFKPSDYYNGISSYYSVPIWTNKVRQWAYGSGCSGSYTESDYSMILVIFCYNNGITDFVLKAACNDHPIHCSPDFFAARSWDSLYWGMILGNGEPAGSFNRFGVGGVCRITWCQ